MFGVFTYIKYQLKSILRNRTIYRDKQKSFGQNALQYSEKQKSYADRSFLGSAEASNEMQSMLISGTPFMACRYGGFEVLNMRSFDFKHEKRNKQQTRFNLLVSNAGFFPNDISLGIRFTELMKESTKSADFFAVWYNTFEDYYIKMYSNMKAACFYLNTLEPWSSPSNPWSVALKGKKVLVIHPFSETIESQYKKRELIFPGTDILPEFELKTLKAVQTIAGEKDDRFESWFDALEWMYQEALKIDFDVAIIGCGAYGFPLAAMLKESGKQAIHLGGATQIMFGIKGRRWDEQPEYAYVRNLYNDAWVYPSEADKPKQAKKVEGGCYW